MVLLNFFIDQLKDLNDIRKVLVVGCNWGVDLLSLKKIKPDWKITGVDGAKEIVSAGTQLMKSKGIDTLVYGDDGHLPFPDEFFDLVISLKHFSHIYQPLAECLAKEMLRVARYGIVQLEDLRGPTLSMQMKLYSIPDIYLKLGCEIDVRSIKISDKNSGLYIIKVKK